MDFGQPEYTKQAPVDLLRVGPLRQEGFGEQTVLLADLGRRTGESLRAPLGIEPVVDRHVLWLGGVPAPAVLA